MIHIIFNSDGSFKMTSSSLDGLDKMIEDEFIGQVIFIKEFDIDIIEKIEGRIN